MPTTSLSIGTTPELVVGLEDNPFEWIDIIVQNLSANNVYVLSDKTGDTTTGLKIIANGNYVNDHRGEPIVLVADGATSDVRIIYTKFLDSTRQRV